MKYKIEYEYKQTIVGEAIVEANNEEEAEEKFNEGQCISIQDKKIDNASCWQIEDIEEIEEISKQKGDDKMSKKIILDIEEIAEEAIKYGNKNLGGIFEEDGETLKVEVLDFIREYYTHNIVDMCIHEIFNQSNVEY